MVFVRGPETRDIQHFVEKVVFRLHESFPISKRESPSGPHIQHSAPSLILSRGHWQYCNKKSLCDQERIFTIDHHCKRDKELPKKMCFKYQLNLEGDHLRCETLTFNNHTKDFRRKLIKAGAVMIVPKGAKAATRSSPDSSIPPTKKIKTSHVSEEPSKE
ncbi:protein ENL [Perca flavescens]|uniref:protein ENL n=1 Tax=Perca flavescens TaxID=8167 RepID=UPI00106E2309|nr:protein ENL-like [Perca flavescens]XP_028443794.1 protein ENL-like [Perca flavescens]